MATKPPHSFSDKPVSIRKRLVKVAATVWDVASFWLIALMFVAGLVWLFARITPRAQNWRPDPRGFDKTTGVSIQD